MKLNSAEGANLINVQYAVMFGVIFTFSFSLRSCPKFHIIPVISKENVVLYLLLLGYFLIDWVRSNFIREKIDFTFSSVIMWTIAIWSLGLVVIMINSSNSLRFMLLSLYITSVGFYDIYFLSKYIGYSTTQPSSLVWIIIAGITSILGVFLFIPSILSISGISGAQTYLKETALIVGVIFFISRGIIRSILIGKESKIS